ncbi:MAG: hypothetical protein CVV25_13715 [Ignavibacteriae bacterium HGW-Ignavibacteriae-4]|jgi:hypothetical protein|nr:MAG: hypothetical protein CVV25_13715 [Ignavibacteriae bacterium HGW-Ignavibacteriae-4]
MKTGLIYSILILLFLSYGESNASINNDTLFTSPNENTALVQQFIDSLESVDTDYIVHVKKIDNSTDQTLYSNYILWADVSVKVANKYGVKELDELEYENGIVSINKTGFSRKLSYGKSLFRLLNTHQDTFFEKDPFITIPITQKNECVIKVEIWNGGKTLKLEFPCELDFNSEYYSKLSGSLLYPIYLLIDKEIASYIDIQDFYTRVYGDREESYADDMKEEIRYMKRDLIYYKEYLQKVKNKIKNIRKETFSIEFNVYTSLPNWENTDSLFIDSLCRSGVEDMIVDYKHMGWSWIKYPDTTHDASGFSTNILWRERNSEFIKVKFFSKLYESPTYLFENELFKFLDKNRVILSDSVLNRVNNYKESKLWKKEKELKELEKDLERRRRELEILNGDYPLIDGDTIIVYGDIVEPNKITVSTDGGSLSETYHLFYKGFETKYSTLWFSDENYKYLFKEYTGSGLFTLELILDEIMDDFFKEKVIYFADCKTNKLNFEATKNYWITEIENIKKSISDLKEGIESSKEYIIELESENNSK